MGSIGMPGKLPGAPLWSFGTPPGAMKLRTDLSPAFGSAPPADKIQEYPGVARKYNPIEAYNVYKHAIVQEKKQNGGGLSDATRHWFKRHRKEKREEERVGEIMRQQRDMCKSRSTSILAAAGITLRPGA